MQILLAEDNPVNQKVAVRMLQRLGYEADIAMNGREAVEALEKKQYDIILMDMQMPEMDGLEATKRIVATYPEGQRPHIIALTANAMQGDRERCLEAGMHDYISKHIRLEDLTEAFGRYDGPRTVAEKVEEEEDSEGEPSVIDYAILQELIEMLGDDIDFACGLIGDFLVDGAELVTNMRISFESGNTTDLARAAHTLKSSSATFGAMDAAELAKQIEALAHEGAFSSETNQYLQKLEQLFPVVHRELEAYIMQHA